MNDKKSVVITLRTTEEIKNCLEKEAEEKEWSISKLCEKIIAKHYEEKNKPTEM